ncbi:MAG: ribbon-helix-helix domain-containing protein [Alphaproteobacteria bacterium]|nr:ribbon-helix-helix domain-containing protein [Alphaproteobacteria bacterium]MCK5518935.1 ribbon-helix-helix domain-containing protein [Alphaproteobacteria bacterium]
MTDRAHIVQKRSVTIAGHRTSVTLEKPFWDSLKEIANARSQSVNALIAEIDRQQQGNLSSTLRVFILRYYKAK